MSPPILSTQDCGENRTDVFPIAHLIVEEKAALLK